jgi:hypothetical protein
MICNNCHTEIDSNSVYCLICGKKVDESDLELVRKNESKIWSVFANIGYKTGKFSLIFCFLISIAYFGYVSIVICALGMQSTTQFEKAQKGLKFSIISVVLNHIILTIVAITIIILKRKGVL